MIKIGRDSRGGKRGAGGIISTGERDLNFEKTGISFSKLSDILKYSINTNLKMSSNMKNDIKSGRKNKMTDEWTTGRGKNKIKVITDVKDGKVVYSIKQKNKYLKKDVSKEQVANGVAKFYLDMMN